MGAIGERIAKPPREGIADFGETSGACRGIGRNLGAHAACVAFGDPESIDDGKRPGLVILDGIDARERRAFGLEIGDKTFGEARSGRHADENALGIVAHVASKPKACRKTPHRRPEADALHQAADADLGGDGRREWRRSRRQSPQHHTIIAGIGNDDRVTASGETIRPAQAVAHRRLPAIIAFRMKIRLPAQTMGRGAHAEIRMGEAENARIGGIGNGDALGQSGASHRAC